MQAPHTLQDLSQTLDQLNPQEERSVKGGNGNGKPKPKPSDLIGHEDVILQ